MLRNRSAGLGPIMSKVDAGSRATTPEHLFVTLFAGILDLERRARVPTPATRTLAAAARAGGSRRIVGDGPPLCALGGFDYRRGAKDPAHPEPGCAWMSDDVSEAQDAGGALYGSQRVLDVLAATSATAPVPPRCSRLCIPTCRRSR